MTIDDIPHWAKNGGEGRDLALRVFNYCQCDPSDKFDMERRIAELTHINRCAEEQRRTFCFFCELHAFNCSAMAEQQPHWIAEAAIKGVKSPDFYYSFEGAKIPAEVKIIDMPAIDSSELRSFARIVRELPQQVINIQAIIAKLDYHLKDAKGKFQSFHRDNNDRGTLYLYYVPLLHYSEDDIRIVKKTVNTYLAKKMDSQIEPIFLVTTEAFA